MEWTARAAMLMLSSDSAKEDILMKMMIWRLSFDRTEEVSYSCINLHAQQHLSRGVLPRFDAPIQVYRKMTGSEYV